MPITALKQGRETRKKDVFLLSNVYCGPGNVLELVYKGSRAAKSMGGIGDVETFLVDEAWTSSCRNKAKWAKSRFERS